jgi:cell division topological specificity factor
MDLFKLFSSKSSSKDVAKERLQLILIHDRSDLSQEFLEMIKAEILKVISNYAEIENGDIEVKLTRTEASEGNAPALVASIPIKSMRKKL